MAFGGGLEGLQASIFMNMRESNQFLPVSKKGIVLNSDITQFLYKIIFFFTFALNVIHKLGQPTFLIRIDDTILKSEERLTKWI